MENQVKSKISFLECIKKFGNYIGGFMKALVSNDENYIDEKDAIRSFEEMEKEYPEDVAKMKKFEAELKKKVAIKGKNINKAKSSDLQVEKVKQEEKMKKKIDNERDIDM